MLQPVGAHARFIHSVVRGASCDAGKSAPEHVKRSWRRCLEEFSLDPNSNAEPVVVAREELLARKERNLELVSFADPEMAHLYRQLAGSGYSIILTDRDGVLLSYYGDPSFKGAASRAGLVPGAVWSERHGGTNGMGTCLFERTPLIIHRHEHFLTRNTGLTCCAAPIFDHRGELIAALDASGQSDRAQQHTLVLVSMSAQMIENRLFLQRFRNAFVVRFHSRPELVGTWSEGIIALDLSGAITAVDRNALFQLGCKGADDLINAPLERVFDVSLPALVERSHKKSFHPLPIHEAGHRGRFFAVAQGPESGQRATGAIGIAPRIAPSLPNARRSALDVLDLGDPLMARNIRAAKRVASRDVAILLIGETGTGKEAFARALHAESDDAGRAFVAVNCASITESELFGEGEGGKIAQARGGTLFLDEIGDLPGVLQGRLLGLVEEHELTRVDVRLVCAARCNLDEKVRHGEFREDLFYRLQGLVLRLPRLQEREDKRALLRQVLAQETAETRSVSLSEGLVDALCACQWPGNIRQLRNALRGMIARRSGDRLGLEDLPEDYGIGPPAEEPAAPSPESVSLNALGRAQRDALLRELQIEQGNLSQIARKLGVSRNTLYRKMHHLGIAVRSKKAVH